MAQLTSSDRLLPANAKTIQKAIKNTHVEHGSVAEFRISGVRGLVLHVLPSGAATWYVHYDVAIGRTRRRRKHKIGRFDEVSLADATAEAEQLRPAIRKGADPVAERDIARTAITFAELAEARLKYGDPLRATTDYDYRHVLKKDILPCLGAIPPIRSLGNTSSA